ncbi:hypothetical protein [Paenibacillus hexagrammi]|uniref:Uncharacterized protein n=1 Tax=Paenibacillus hexagrammi TaxID=2908839 RepID=A0ABY3SHU9_9BACL|nr:hypothetical protein [Paenibacillus sp. YPD9-1]UJF32796.1 hypothetical protein L0M14_24955 [Paenibacillus sp. YPD9-1]
MGVMIIYAAIWFMGNYLSLRKEDAGTRIGMQLLSPVIIGAVAYVSFQIFKMLVQ